MQYPIASGTVALGTGDRPPGTGTPGEYSSGNPAAVPPALPTEIAAADLNQVFLELINVIENGGGLTPSGSDLGQLLEALNLMIGPRGAVAFLTGGNFSFTPPAGVRRLLCTLIGAGGKGSAPSSTYISGVAGGGGGGGQTVIFTQVVTPSVALAGVVGVAGVQPTSFLGRSAGFGGSAPIGPSSGSGSYACAGGAGGSGGTLLGGETVINGFAGYAGDIAGASPFGGAGGPAFGQSLTPGSFGMANSGVAPGAGSSGQCGSASYTALPAPGGVLIQW